MKLCSENFRCESLCVSMCVWVCVCVYHADKEPKPCVCEWECGSVGVCVCVCVCVCAVDDMQVLLWRLGGMWERCGGGARALLTGCPTPATLWKNGPSPACGSHGTFRCKGLQSSRGDIHLHKWQTAYIFLMRVTSAYLTSLATTQGLCPFSKCFWLLGIKPLL